MSGRLITVYWRDIPVQLIAKKGRRSVRVALTERFQTAVDRAAMRAGKGSSDKYLEDWRREARSCGEVLQEEAEAAAARLEAAFSDEQLERLVKAGGARSGE